MTLQAAHKRFTLLDALALIAATAVGLALTRGFESLDAIVRMESVSYRDRGEYDAPGKLTAFKAIYSSTSNKSPKLRMQIASWLQRATLWPCPCLAAWTLAVLSLAILAAPSSLRESLQRPGMMAGLAWAMGFSVVAVSSPSTLFWTLPGGGVAHYWRDLWYLTWFDLPRSAGFAVAVSWSTLALTGRFWLHSGWADRIGTFLGCCWIALGCLNQLSIWLCVV